MGGTTHKAPSIMSIKSRRRREREMKVRGKELLLTRGALPMKKDPPFFGKIKPSDGGKRGKKGAALDQGSGPTSGTNKRGTTVVDDTPWTVVVGRKARKSGVGAAGNLKTQARQQITLKTHYHNNRTTGEPKR